MMPLKQTILSPFLLFHFFLVLASFLVDESNSFSTSSAYPVTANNKLSACSALEATKAPQQETQSGSMSPNYSNEELKEALDSMLKDSTNREYDARHIFGHGKPDHELSMLQIITATRILDYRDLMVGMLLY